jgi:hypothetical protein
MNNQTAFFIFGIAAAVSAVVVAFVGLRVKEFPGKAMPFVVLWFVILVGGATTFAVLHGKDEDKAKGAEYAQANKEIEKAEGSGPFEAAEKEAAEREAAGGEAAEGGEEEAAEGGEGASAGGSSLAGEGGQVYASVGCGTCHAFKAAGSTGAVGPDLSESLASDDNRAGIEEMIVDPNAEIVEGYAANVMPQNFGELLSKKELAALVEFLYVNSAAGEGK